MIEDPIIILEPIDLSYNISTLFAAETYKKKAKKKQRERM